MKLIYNEPRNILLEVEKAVNERRTKEEDGQVCKLRQIVLTKDEMELFKQQLTSDWDNNSSVQCYHVASNDDPYCGGYNYLEWTGLWHYKGGRVEIVEFKV